MDKVYKKIAILSFMIVVLSFMACGDDGEDVDNGSQYLPLPSITKRLTKVSINNSVYNYTYYNDGRIKEIRRNKNSYSTFTYKENQIIEDVFDNGIIYQDVYTIENGRIIKEYDGDHKKTIIFGYKNGYLTTVTKESDNPSEYEWSDGNLKTIWEGGKAIYEYEYTNHSAPHGFFKLHSHAEISSHWGMSGYLGQSIKNLPSKMIEAGFETYYNWTIEDGLPVKMIQEVFTTLSGSTYKYSGNNYTFEWE